MFGRRKKVEAQAKPLNYDTQIDLIFPPELFSDPIIAPLLKQVGIELEAKGNKLMLFTDARTVAALNADQEVKEVVIQSGIGTVLYGWNQEGRVAFLTRELRAIAEKYAGDQEALRLAVFDLHRFISNAMLGKVDPNPLASPLPVLSSSDKFDLAAAIECMLEPEQINKPKAPSHLAAWQKFGNS